MNLELHIPERIEQQLREQASAAGQNLESFVLKAVEDSLEDLNPSGAIRRPPQGQWFAELKKWAEGHPRVGHFVDDSRDSIYSDGD